MLRNEIIVFFKKEFNMNNNIISRATEIRNLLKVQQDFTENPIDSSIEFFQFTHLNTLRKNKDTITSITNRI